MTRHGRRQLDRFLLQALAIVLAFLVLSPFLWLLVMSFKTNAEIFRFPPRLFFPATLDNYAALWTSDFRGSFANSLIVSVASTFVSLVVGVPAAYALSRWTGRASGTITLWILASRMAPPIAFTIPYFLAYRHLELLDTLSGLTIIYLTFNLSLVIWMMQPFFDGVPRELEEAAWIDGCGVWQAFRVVTMPLAAPGLAATAVICFIMSWNDFFYALVLTRTEVTTYTVQVTHYFGGQSNFWAKIAAMSVLGTIPVFFTVAVMQRYLVRGISMGAVKG